MGYDSQIKIKKKMISDVSNLLASNGYKERLMKPSIIPTIKHYCFYEEDDYKYFEGVNFSIHKFDRNYILAGRNSISASDYDVIKHNETLKLISKKLNIEFNTDYGSDALFPITKNPKRGLVNGIYFPYWHVSNQLNQLEHFCSSIPKQTNREKNIQKLFGSVFQSEIYGANICVNHLVTIMEMYFRNTFIVLLENLNLSQQKIMERKISIRGYLLNQYRNGLISWAEAIANSCSFQNIDSICRNYYLINSNIDLKSLYRLNGKNTYYKKLDRIFTQRHLNIHELKQNENYNYNDFLTDCKIIENVIKKFYRYLCNVYNVKPQE